MDDSDREELVATATNLIIGAGESVALFARHIDDREFGLDLEDLANAVDNRLRLRCLLRLPGILRDRDGSLHRSIEDHSHGLNVLRRSMRVLEDAGWETRLTTGGRLGSDLIIDTAAMIYYSYLNEPPGPFFTSDHQQIAQHLGGFEAAWEDSFEPSAAESLYDHTDAFVHPEQAARIAVVSHAAWERLIGDLARSPERIHELDSRRFEELVAELLHRDGLHVQLTPATRDGGRDILAFHDTPVGKHLYLVECKRQALDRPVGVAVVRQLYGLVAQERATAGLVVATSRFSREALTFAEPVRHQMGLKDYEAVKKWLRSHSAGSA